MYNTQKRKNLQVTKKDAQIVFEKTVCAFLFYHEETNKKFTDIILSVV